MRSRPEYRMHRHLRERSKNPLPAIAALHSVKTHWCSGINHVGGRANARDAERNGLVGLEERRPVRIDGARLADVGRIPVIAVYARRQSLLLRLRPRGRVGSIGISVNIQHVHRVCLVPLAFPVDLVQPPGQQIDTRVGALATRVRAIPVKPPAAANGPEPYRLRVPASEIARFAEERVTHFVVCRP